METYIERVNRFVVEYHEFLPSSHQAQMRINGIDPDNYWQLKWSFETEQAAIDQCEEDSRWYAKFCSDNGFQNVKRYRVRDLGAAIEIERSVMF